MRASEAIIEKTKESRPEVLDKEFKEELKTFEDVVKNGGKEGIVCFDSK